MHEHNEELIMALAEEVLSPAEATVAATEIEACAQCSTDLELIRVALDATSQAPQVYMSATESSRLHEALHRELRLATPIRAEPRPRPAWGRVAGWAFGAAAVFLGAVLMLPALFGGSDDASDAVAAATIEERGGATTAAAFEPSQALPEVGLDDGATANGDVAADEGAEDSPAADTEVTTFDTDLGLSVMAEDALTEEIREEIIAALRLDPNTYRSDDAAAKAANPSYATCVEQTMADGYAAGFSPPEGSEPQLVGLLDSGGEEQLLVAYVPPNLDETAVASVSSDSCELIDALP